VKENNHKLKIEKSKAGIKKENRLFSPQSLLNLRIRKNPKNH